jgi:hypothetical protein
MKLALTFLATLLFALSAWLALPTDAQCGAGCAAVPCFRGGPPCMGHCSCQWRDGISGVCG